MTHARLKKLLRGAGIGGFFGKGIRLFDTGFHLFYFEDIDSRVQAAMENLKADGLTPGNYRRNGADCDNWAMWIQSEVTKQWAVDRKENVTTPTIAFGRAGIPGHEINVAVCLDGIFCWNYGRVAKIDLKTIKEIEFK